ncbi:MAG: sigma-54-dependent Fis family transcriptional regulator, partial [Deltaproteobacteria bacterium]
MERKGTLKKAWEDVVLRGLSPRYAVRPEILASWQRCKAMGLDPFVLAGQRILIEKEFEERIQANARLIEAARPIMQLVEISVRGTGFITTLTDSEGYVLEVCGDQEILQMARENFYIPGCNQSEAISGTNAISLCLIEKKPMQVTGAEHYHAFNHSWTCSSAPIFNSKGELLGVITLSGKSTKRHRHTLALVISAAKAIEGKLIEGQLIADKEKLNRLLTSTLNSIPEAIIVLDEKLNITHLNDQAREWIFKGRTPIGRPLK